MNERLTEIYKSCRPKEALASQEQYNSSNVLIGAEVEKFVELIVAECCNVLQTETIRHDGYGYNQGSLHKKIKDHFGVKE
jgi:hypothetical protein